MKTAYFCEMTVRSRMRNNLNSKNRESTVDNIINEIESKAADGDYIYRGEPKRYPKVSSSLYREYAEIDIETFDLTEAQSEMLKIAREHIGESPVGPLEDFMDIVDEVRGYRRKLPGRSTEDFIGEAIAKTAEREILTELQHYGGKTNLIDFTTDYFIALYFACSGHPKKVGRVLLLEKNEEIEGMIIRPRNPRHRVVAQKSVFLHPPQGYIEVSEGNMVFIPIGLKQPLLDYLRKFHDISTQSIYNDIHGFIRYQSIHQNAYVQFYMGLRLQFRTYQTGLLKEIQLDNYRKAIEHYDNAIDQNPDLKEAYCNRGECWLHLREWEKAVDDLTTAQKMGVDIVDAFHNSYESVADFKDRTGIMLPPYLVGMLEDVDDTSPNGQWTLARFNELLSSEEYRELYESQNQIEKLCEFGADLMALVEKKQWDLTYKFKKHYFAFYLRRRRVFGVNLRGRPRLTVWLPGDILAGRNNDLYDSEYTCEHYYDSRGIYPEDVTVANIKEVLEFAYSWYADLL